MRGRENSDCARAQRVLVVDALHPQVHTQAGRPDRLPAEVELVPFDVTDPVAWDALLKIERPATVVHLAAETGTSQSLRESSRHGQVNCVGTTQMLDAFTRSGHVPGHVVLTSSRAVYGEGEWEADGERYRPSSGRTNSWNGRVGPALSLRCTGSAAAECGRTDLAEPTSVYGATKLAQEHICRSWTAGMGSALTVLRLQNVYGVGQSLGNPYTGVLSLFTKLALSGGILPVYEDGNIVRDFVYIDDVVAAAVSAIAARPCRRVVPAWSTWALERRRPSVRWRTPLRNWPGPRSPKSRGSTMTETSGQLRATSARRSVCSDTSQSGPSPKGWRH